MTVSKTVEGSPAEGSTERSDARGESKAEAPRAATPTRANQETVPFTCNASSALACYANFCRVTGTPEELIVDFALNSQPGPAITEEIKVTQRLIINYYTAKRLLQALAISVQRHEAAFGVLETDVQKRVTRPQS